jgi:pimeloyl-ACP methyl ester carboxylesterase
MKRKTILFLLLAVLILAAGGFSIWAYTPLGPLPEGIAALQSSASVTVQVKDWVEFSPAGQTPTVGLILYPGGRVDYRSYAPLARAIAAEGYLVVLTPMPFNLAVFNPNRAYGVVSAHPEIQAWAIGGHSLGGSMAANYVKNHPGKIAGLLLMASYPAGTDDLSQQNLQVTSIYGTLDGLATPQKVKAAQPLLPASTRWVAIEGGDHAQFGWYGPQPGDNPAAIDRSTQQAQVIQAAVDLLAGLGK